MVQVFGNRILGGIGAPGGGMSEAFGAGANTAINQRQTRQAMAERDQLMRQRETLFGQGQEDRARTAAAFDSFGVPGGAGGTPGVNVGGFFGGQGATVAPDGFRLGAPGQVNVRSGPPAGEALTFGLLRKFEGFRDTPYWDVNAYRTGYGSDTVTMSDGSVVPVRQGMRVSREDAERDLMRRVETEFAPRAASQVGVDVWRSLPEYVSGPLVSIAYNYGSLPRNIAEAAKTGDPEQIARAIEARAGDNNGVNRARRMQEAAIVRSGGQIDPGLMRAAAAPVGAEGVSRVPAEAVRSYMTPESMSTRAGLGAPYAAALAAANIQAPVSTAQQVADATSGARAEGSRFLGTTDRILGNVIGGAEGLVGLGAGTVGLGASALGFPEFGQTMLDAAGRRFTDAERLAREGYFGANMAQADIPLDEIVVQAPTESPVEVQQAGPDTPRPRARPELNFEESEAALVAAEDAAAAPVEQFTPRGPSRAQMAFDPMAPYMSGAGLQQPGATTADVAAGATLSTASPDFPGLGALLNDSMALQLESRQLDIQEDALRRQLEFARQTRDANTMLTTASQLALVEARRGVMGYISAGNAAATGNFDPMAQALSEMAGAPVRILPRGDGTFNVMMGQQPIAEGIDGNTMIQQYMLGVNDTYRQQVASAQAAAAERAKMYLETELEVIKETAKQASQLGREQQLEIIKAELARVAGTNPEIYAQTMTTADGEQILFYDRGNPGAPIKVVRLRPNPQTGGMDVLVQENVANATR